MERPRSSLSGQSVTPSIFLRFSRSSSRIAGASFSTPRRGGGVLLVQPQTNSTLTTTTLPIRNRMKLPSIAFGRTQRFLSILLHGEGAQIAILEHALRSPLPCRADHGPSQLLGGDHRARRDTVQQRQQR